MVGGSSLALWNTFLAQYEIALSSRVFHGHIDYSLASPLRRQPSTRFNQQFIQKSQQTTPQVRIQSDLRATSSIARYVNNVICHLSIILSILSNLSHNYVTYCLHFHH